MHLAAPVLLGLALWAGALWAYPRLASLPRAEAHWRTVDLEDHRPEAQVIVIGGR